LEGNKSLYRLYQGILSKININFTFSCRINAVWLNRWHTKPSNCKTTAINKEERAACSFLQNQWRHPRSTAHGKGEGLRMAGKE